MFLTLDKFKKRMEDLGKIRYRDMQSVFPFVSMEDDMSVDDVHTKCRAVVDGRLVQQNEFFTGRDKYFWLRKEIILPEERAGCQVVGLFDFGKTGGGHNSGFESLLYVDREPWQGVDSNHHDSVFQDLAGKKVELTFLLWTGLEGGGKHQIHYHQLKQAEIGYLHLDTDALYYYVKAISGTIQYLPEDRAERHKLTSILDQTLQKINWVEEYLYESISEALSFLEKELEKMEKNSGYTVSVVGHTHIDVAWLWRLKHTREKSIRSFSTVLRLMEEFDEYIFLQTQPQLYKYIKTDYPEIYAKMKERIQDGHWEADGGMWLEADCNISSGEALVRQFLHGCGFLNQEFGQKCQYLWLPDVFGYSWALPQILKQCNIKTFVTTKISWNQYNRMPHDLFVWRGIDGSEVLSYFITTPEPGTDENSFFATYNGQLTPETVNGTWSRFRDKNISPQVLISYGYGDGGGGVNREMLKMRNVMDKIPGLPAVKTEKAADFLEKSHKYVSEAKDYVHTWDGELYLEYHRGTYTSQAKNKKWNRKLEWKLAETEWLSVAAELSGISYPADVIKNGWETVLRNQFHDIIPGSSIHEVYEDSAIEYQAADVSLDAVRKSALSGMLEDCENAYVIYHFGSFAGKELIFVPKDVDGEFVDSQGEKLDSQRVKDGYVVSVEMPPLSFTQIFFKEKTIISEVASFDVSIEARKLSTPFYQVEWNEEWQLISLYDKKYQKEVLAAPANILEIFEDKPIRFDAWDIDIFYMQKKEIIKNAGAPELIECGALRTILRFKYAYHLSSITQDVIFYRDSGRIDFKTSVDWQESEKLLKAAFPVNVRSVKATYDIQFGHVERPTHFNTSWDYARFEVVGHKWADLSESNYGVSLLNESKYGYSIKDNVMKISLLKSALYPDLTADKGIQEFTYALLPHVGTVVQSHTLEESVSLNIPAGIISGKMAAPMQRLFDVHSENVHIDAIKKAEDENCLILRFHECRGGTSKFEISSDYGIKEFAACNLLEETQGSAVHDSLISGTIKPFEIKTYKIWLK